MLRVLLLIRRNMYLLFEAMFLVSGVGKLKSQQDFKRMLVTTGLERRHAGTVSQLLPALELGLSMMPLLLRGQRNLFLAITSMLLSVFSGFLVSVKLNGIDVECRCFGMFLARLQGRWAVLRNIALIGLGIVSIDSDKNSMRVAGVDRPLKTIALLGSMFSFFLSTAAFASIHNGVAALETGPITKSFTVRDSHARELDADSFFGRCRAMTALLYLGDNCQPCDELSYELSQLSLQFREPFIVICGLSASGLQTEQMEREKFIGKRCDFWDLTGSLAGALDLKGIPALIILDANKREVLSRYVGAVEVRRWISESLNEIKS